MRDAAMFGGKNYWLADFVLVSLILVLLGYLGRKAITGFFKKACEVA